jgi:hypothetical protein
MPSGTTADGKLTGRPYADLARFFYNAKMAEQAGTAAPETWEELTRSGVEDWSRGCRVPINIPLKKDDLWTTEIFYSMVYSRGGTFDEENNLFSTSLAGG